MKSSGNISLSCLREGSGVIDALIFFWCFTEERQFSGWNHIQVPASPPCSIHQTAKASTLTETTLKQLEVLSEMLRLMSKPNKNSKRLKANIVDWTPSAVSVNLSLSELRPNQIQILRWGHKSRHRYALGRTRARSHARGNAIHTGSGAIFWCSCVAPWVMSWGMRRGRAGPELLRCSFVYTDGFQMLACDRSATERWGAAQQFGACASKPGLRQLYLGYLKNMALLCNNFAIVSKRLREFEKSDCEWSFCTWGP